MTIQEAIKNIHHHLLSDESTDGLERLVDDLRKEEWPQNSMYLLLDVGFWFLWRNEERLPAFEAKRDWLTDTTDFIVGWCSNCAKFFPEHYLTNEEVEEIQRSGREAGLYTEMD
jgi:hypothetical protein